MVESLVQLVDGVRPERVANFGAVERDPDRAVLLRAWPDVPVVGDVGQIFEAGHRAHSSGLKVMAMTLIGPSCSERDVPGHT